MPALHLASRTAFGFPSRPFIVAAILLASCATVAVAQPSSATPNVSENVAAGTTPAVEPTADQPSGPKRAVAVGPGVTSWDTFMYEGPGQRYTVIDEVIQGTRLSILRCVDGWCEVAYHGGKAGYVVAEVLASAGVNPALPQPGYLPQPAADIGPAPDGPCIETIQTGGNGGKALTRFCQKRSQ